MKTTTARLTTAIYARLSKARKTKDGRIQDVSVKRQIEECRHLAKTKGWTVTGTYIDNDISASRFARRKRPRYGALLADIEQGRVQRVLCFKLDRLYRRPQELEVLI